MCLNWYEKQPRTLTDEFIREIPWHDVKNYPTWTKNLFPCFAVYARCRDFDRYVLRRNEAARRPAKTRLSANLWNVGELKKLRTAK